MFSKYLSRFSKTFSRKGSNDVSATGSFDKRMISATGFISLSEIFIPIQMIYGGKVSKNI